MANNIPTLTIKLYQSMVVNAVTLLAFVPAEAIPQLRKEFDQGAEATRYLAMLAGEAVDEELMAHTIGVVHKLLDASQHISDYRSTKDRRNDK